MNWMIASHARAYVKTSILNLIFCLAETNISGFKPVLRVKGKIQALTDASLVWKFGDC